MENSDLAGDQLEGAAPIAVFMDGSGATAPRTCVAFIMRRDGSDGRFIRWRMAGQ